ncbi:putative iron-sulfur protein [Streptomyces ambofaciens ATCC 23877]|uniref:Putative iron-sulfur protein n=1 Tax=Streptomyces ambofaciens (strain ATCC 23877 / 3486 / DSM 40053 / JCM 4204 / NBRC 12836 / NRRL B-2516) TaxID=278992 RepID=A0ADL6_STRA7|nr:putative iron-sulfur protein [Streptomyces ambofaciens ATCC 23877]CAJ88572.1 putative iron-sulfur protein [Streptomyces ambofaciens ATCC 23877]
MRVALFLTCVNDTLYPVHRPGRGRAADQTGRRGRLPDGPDLLRAGAEAARLHLREKFLRARVGISGANFMVAETGTLVVVESEGNGRMCLTLPETLISVVGIEKVIPTWRDLEVFLQLLPRSSTAERMNPYTTMWTGTTDGDGPRAFHLVLLDNGRTDTLADEVGRQALRCIRCSACLNVCPVYERAGGHGSQGPPRPATSSWTGSRGCTVRAPWRWCWWTVSRAGRSPRSVRRGAGGRGSRPRSPGTPPRRPGPAASGPCGSPGGRGPRPPPGWR